MIRSDPPRGNRDQPRPAPEPDPELLPAQVASAIDRLWKTVDRLRKTVERLLERIEADALSGAPDALLTREQAADRLSISVRKLDQLAEAGEIRAIRIDRAVRYHPESLDRFIRRRAAGGNRR